MEKKFWKKFLWGTDKLSRFLRAITALLLFLGIFSLFLEWRIKYGEKTSRLDTEPYKAPLDSQKKQLYSFEDSKYFLLKKFPEIILGIEDRGGSVYITIKDSFWYNKTMSQRQMFADRLLDVIYASGDVKRTIYLQDQRSRTIAKQRIERVKVPGMDVLERQPYMDLQ